MAQKKKKSKKSDAPLPVAGAGLIRFFEEEVEGVKVRPELIIAFSFAFILVVLLARLGMLPF